jgi:DNA mismatch endonuclease (patch repair protein)
LTDIVEKETRSRWMTGIGGKDTRPELIVRKLLHKAGLRYVLNDKRLPGKPDIVMPKHRLCIFVHGCFWHRHEGCKLAASPATRQQFWQEKFAGNVIRDKRNLADLAEMGWRVIVIWECGLKHGNASDRLPWLPDEVRTDTQ